MSDNLKRHLISATLTFASSFLTIFGSSLIVIDTGDISVSIIGALIISSARGALKVLIDKHVPIQLGGTKNR